MLITAAASLLALTGSISCMAPGGAIQSSGGGGDDGGKRDANTPQTVVVGERPIITDWNFQLFTPLRHTGNGYNFPQRPPPDTSTLVPAFRYTGPSTYVPMPQPGGAHGPGFSGWMSWLVQTNAQRVAQANAPVGLLIRNRNAPFPYAAHGKPVEPNALRDALNSLDRLDFVFMDLEFEPEMIERNVREVVRLVRSHPNPAINQAVIGNYDDYPGSFDPAKPWDNQRDRTNSHGSWDRDSFFRSSGMNVAMPSAYPYEAYNVHAEQGNQRVSGACPSVRAALLWAPLERVGVAARNLPAGDKLIPWVSNYSLYEFPDPRDLYHAPPPPIEDVRALITHIRLRGADGYVLWTSNDQQTDHAALNYTQYRELALNAWSELDAYMPAGVAHRILNLEDPKTTGVIWSGAIAGDKAVVFVSNVAGNGRAASVSLPAIPGLPESTPAVEDGTHRMFVFQLPSGSTQARAPGGDGASTGTPGSNDPSPDPVIPVASANVPAGAITPSNAATSRGGEPDRPTKTKRRRPRFGQSVFHVD